MYKEKVQTLYVPHQSIQSFASTRISIVLSYQSFVHTYNFVVSHSVHNVSFKYLRHCPRGDYHSACFRHHQRGKFCFRTHKAYLDERSQPGQ